MKGMRLEDVTPAMEELAYKEMSNPNYAVNNE